MIKRIAVVLCAAGIVLVAGCAKPIIPEPEMVPDAKDYYRELPPGMAVLRKILEPWKIPDFRSGFDADCGNLLKALDESIRYFGYKSSKNYYPIQGITHDRALQSLLAFRDLLLSAGTREEFHQRLVDEFDIYESVGCDLDGTVLFTGYYAPIFEGSLPPTAEFRYPLYKLPADLVKSAEGQRANRRLADGSLVPYYTRGEIDDGALSGKGLEQVYLKDRFEAYICTIQGSAQLRLPGGDLLKIGYHGSNGRDYTSVSRQLVDRGLLPREELSLAGLTKFFKARPELLDVYLPTNERYVFFRRTDSDPVGSLNLPVTPYASLATDKSIFPRGCLTFVDTTVPDGTASDSTAQRPFKRFLLDQDSGGAIRAPGRADIYLGIGEQAGRIAGWTVNEGRLYYLFLKEGVQGT